MKKFLQVMSIVIMVSFSLTAWADTLEMKDGRLLQGTYMGGTQKTLRFHKEGKIVVYPVEEILAITFSSSVSQAAPLTPVPASPQPLSPPPAKQPSPVLQSGTTLTVRVLDALSIKNNKKDDWFKAVLEDDVMEQGQVIVPKGTELRGQVITAEQGNYSSTLALTLREMVIGKKKIPLTTSNHVLQAKAQRVLDINSLKIVRRDREIQVPYQEKVNFILQKDVIIDKAKRAKSK